MHKQKCKATIYLRISFTRNRKRLLVLQLLNFSRDRKLGTDQRKQLLKKIEMLILNVKIGTDVVVSFRILSTEDF